MSEDDPDDVDRRPSGAPLPPDDRLWRHPSELAALPLDGPGQPATDRARAWPAAALGIVAGAALATSGIVLTGSLSPRVVEHQVVEKVAVSPLVSPILGDDRDLDDLVDRVAPAVVRLEAHRGDEHTSASGVVFRDDGVILTAAHPLVGADRLVVVLADGRRLVGSLLGLDEVTDVAVVDVDVDDLPVAVLEVAEDLEIGEVVVALGASPDDPANPSIAAGLVTGLDRWAAVHDGPRLHGLVQTDAETGLHHEGGPLVDATGAVVGVTTAAVDGRSPHGFAVPMHLAHRVALHLLDGREVDHAWLGIEAVDLGTPAQDDLGLAGGALVRDVVVDSPADLAGIGAGDVVTHVGERPVRSVAALVSMLLRCAPGDVVALQVWRDGTMHTTEVVVAERPDG